MELKSSNSKVLLFSFLLFIVPVLFFLEQLIQRRKLVGKVLFSQCQL